jgi:hypothetical protein
MQRTKTILAYSLPFNKFHIHASTQVLASHFLNNRMKRDLGFSGFVQGARGKAVSAIYSSPSGLSTSGLGSFLSGISPILVLSEAKDIIEILLPDPKPGRVDDDGDFPVAIIDVSGALAMSCTLERGRVSSPC